MRYLIPLFISFSIFSTANAEIHLSLAQLNDHLYERYGDKYPDIALPGYARVESLSPSSIVNGEGQGLEFHAKFAYKLSQDSTEEFNAEFSCRIEDRYLKFLGLSTKELYPVMSMALISNNQNVVMNVNCLGDLRTFGKFAGKTFERLRASIQAKEYFDSWPGPPEE